MANDNNKQIKKEHINQQPIKSEKELDIESFNGLNNLKPIPKPTITPTNSGKKNG